MSLSTNDTIRGVQFNGTLYEVIVTDIPAPVILNQTDAIVRITAAGICGSDLHYYRGVAGGGATPYTFGHEAIGIVSEIGDAVTGVSSGDYVVISDTIGDGHLHLDVETEGNTYFGAGEGIDGLQGKSILSKPRNIDQMLNIQQQPSMHVCQSLTKTSSLFP
jgi:threonine dehydrogenase-like Zn-dependent dehydrogenase